MNSKRTQIIAVAVLLAAAIAIVVIKLQQAPSHAADAPGNTSARGASPKSGSADPDTDATNPNDASRSRPRPATANADLVAKYGESRTRLSKLVSTNILGIMDDVVQMGELLQSSQGAFGGGVGMALGRLNGDLQLTDAQREKANTVFKEYQKRQTANARAAVERLKGDSTPLMKLMLASDASSRGEMTDEEYKKTQEEAAKGLAGVINPLDRKNFGGGSPLRDSDFVGGLKGILDPAQSEKLDAEMARRQSDASKDPTTVSGVEEGNMAGLPKMDLDKLDKSIESARKVTVGIKSMMEGMGGLRDVIQDPSRQPDDQQKPGQ